MDLKVEMESTKISKLIAFPLISFALMYNEGRIS